MAPESLTSIVEGLTIESRCIPSLGRPPWRDMRYVMGPGGSDEAYASFAEVLRSEGELVSVEEEPDGTRVFRVRHERTHFSLFSPDEAYDRAQASMGRWFVEQCEKDGTVARLAIEILEEELEAAGGAEDARAKATLRHLIEIATGPRIELVGFPHIPETSPQRS